MSDSHTDDVHKTSGPGHEVDSPPTKELFNIVWGLGGLTLLSIITCAQLFYQQERDIAEERGKEKSYQLISYRNEMAERANGNGELEFKDSAGVVVKQRFKPLDQARAEVLSKPDALKALRAPAGWVHPDDIAAGGQGTAPAGTPAPTDPTLAPNPGQVPTGTDPAAPAGTPPVVAPGVDGAPMAPTGDAAPNGQPTAQPSGATPTSAQPATPAGSPTSAPIQPAPTKPTPTKPTPAPATPAPTKSTPAPAAPTPAPAAPTPAPAAPAPAPAH